MDLDFVGEPVVAAPKELVGLGAVLEGADIRPQVVDNMFPANRILAQVTAMEGETCIHERESSATIMQKQYGHSNGLPSSARPGLGGAGICNLVLASLPTEVPCEICDWPETEPPVALDGRSTNVDTVVWVLTVFAISPWPAVGRSIFAAGFASTFRTPLSSPVARFCSISEAA